MMEIDPRELFKKLGMMQEEKEKEAIGPMPPDLVEEWDTIKMEAGKAQNILEEMMARKSLLWTKIARHFQIFERDLEYRDGVIFAEKRQDIERPLHE